MCNISYTTGKIRCYKKYLLCLKEHFVFSCVILWYIEMLLIVSLYEGDQFINTIYYYYSYHQVSISRGRTFTFSLILITFMYNSGLFRVNQLSLVV